MNVLIVFFVPSGGVETLNRQRAYALKEAGIDCHFLYFQRGAGMQNVKGIPTFITNDDEEIRSILITGNYAAVLLISAFQYLERFRRLGFRGKLIWDIQGFGSIEETRKYLLTAQEAVPAYCDGILYPKTPYLMELAAEYYPGFPRFYFHNCIDTAGFTYKPQPKQPQPVIGWVGRLEPNKNYADFLLLGYRLTSVVPELKLWMFEDHTLSLPEERRKFKELVRAYGLERNLVLRSNVPHDRMPYFYSMIGDSGGFLCSTSRLEGFGYSVLEAMCCKCPVLATDSDGVRSFISHNITGKFYEHGNMDNAVEEAVEYLNNSYLRGVIANQAHAHVLSKFSLAEYRRQFVRMLEELGCYE
ncbi:glycosyltransferase family 4 protein [Paenibacillus sp. S-38]|uniref:glycosyltransferase family 4 protein n=1 Tax=Paenibacillus sp. S-38 TaxID=3416710 RepID=UPI003CEC8292